MSVQLRKLTEFSYRGHSFDLLYVILDSKGAPPILPLLYTTHLCRYGVTYEYKIIRNREGCSQLDQLETKEVTDTSLRSYVYCLTEFLNYVESTKSSHMTLGIHGSSQCSEKFVNFYLNEVLALKLDSESSLEVHRAALSAYFNCLAFFGIKSRIDLKIYRTTKHKVAIKSRIEHYIQYVTKDNRNRLLLACVTLGEKLMMRMGFEVGLRASELAGINVIGKGKLLEIFCKLDDPTYANHEVFQYYLEGRYTKGGVSRWIYFDRNLLHDIKRYYETERQCLIGKSKHNPASLFLRRDQGYQGKAIGTEQASRVFRIRAVAAGLNPLLRFHDLRHTFATELFHYEITRNSGRETRSESAALIVVAQRLGHKFTKSGHAPPTTTRYIRMRLQLMEAQET